MKRSIAAAAPAGAVAGTDVTADVADVSGTVLCIAVLDGTDVESVVTTDEVGAVAVSAAVVGTASGMVLPVFEHDTAVKESRATQATVRILILYTVPGAARDAVRVRVVLRQRRCLTNTGLEAQCVCVGHVNTAAVQRRSREIWSRSLKNGTQEELLRRAVGVVDLTTLEGADTVGRVHRLCSRAVRPDQGVQSVAAVCVYADMASAARVALDVMDVERRVRIACVAGEFPSGRNTPQEKARAAAWAKSQGADEIDMVIDRGAMLSGNYQKVADEVRAVCEASGGGEHVKVILECAELSSLSVIQHASEIAIEAGAGWIKTSTGKLPGGATPENILVMLNVVAQHHRATGEVVGVKAAGGVRTAKDAIRYLALVNETLGEAWIDPDRFRIGASTLLDDLCLQLRHHQTRQYPSSRDLPLA